MGIVAGLDSLEHMIRFLEYYLPQMDWLEDPDYAKQWIRVQVRYKRLPQNRDAQR